MQSGVPRQSRASKRARPTDSYPHDEDIACLTDEERSEFKNRQQRIRDLEQDLAFAQAEQLYDSGVFAGIYK
jgi:hypothetical protein